MTIDDILLYIGLASGLGIMAMTLPNFFRKLLNEDSPRSPKSFLRH